jgi:hypothetical protein
MPRRKYRLSQGAITTIYILIGLLVFVVLVTLIWGC